MTDLRTPYATRLCLSGVESRRLLDTFRDFGVPHIQVSFYYLRRVFGDPLEFEEYAKGFKTVLIDSGTVYGNIKNEDAKEELLQDYKSYLSALNKNSYTACVNEKGLGLDEFIPDEALIYPLEQVRDVFDNDMGARFRNKKYLGVANKDATYKGGELLPGLFAHANKGGAYIHAFGTASKRILNNYPFYSANSSSWRSGSRYLNTYIYEGPSKGLKLYQPTDKKDPQKTEREIRIIRRRQMNMINARQRNTGGLIDYEEMIAGDSWEVDKGNLSQWMLFQRDLQYRGYDKYFLDKEEKQLLLELKKKDMNANNNNMGSSPSNSGGDSSSVPSDRDGAIDGSNSDMDSNSDHNSRDDNDRSNAISPHKQVVPGNAGQEGDTTERDINANSNSSISDNNSGDNNTLRGNRNARSDRADIGGQDIDPPYIPDIEEVDGDISPPYIDSDIVGLPANQQSDIDGDPSSAALPMIPPSTSVSRPRRTVIDERIQARRQCEYCSLQDRCPKYDETPGAMCAYGMPPDQQTYDHDNLEEYIMEDAADILRMQKERIMMSYLEEQLDGSGVSKDLNREIKTYMELVHMLSEATDKRDTMSVKVKKSPGGSIMDMFKN